MIPQPDLEQLYRRAIADAQLRYSPQHCLVSSGPLGEAGGSAFRPAASLPYAQALLHTADPVSVARASDILAAVISSQETSLSHPHCGNFTWLAGDDEVTDLNAVQFVLRGLLPVLMRHENLLPVDLVAKCRACVALALAEEERLDVAPTYTNIHLMSLFALLIGSQWLDDQHYRELATTRWERFVQFTIVSGAPHEYNSSNYLAVDLSTLAAIQATSTEPLIRLQAGLLYERFWLHVGLHYHLPTGQLAGPHCRAYWLPMTTGRSMLSDLLWRLAGWEALAPLDQRGEIMMESLYALELLQTEHHPPAYLFPWMEAQANSTPYEVHEVANATAGDDLITYFTPSYALGTASQTYRIGTNCFYIEHQANYLLLHYTRPNQAQRWGMVYSRFVVNDRHWGKIGAAPDRPKDANFYDQGNFAGLQLRNKSIGLYALEPQHEEVYSIKTLVVFQNGEQLERIWVNDLPVSLAQLPHALQPGDWLIVEDGAVYVGVRPLEASNLGSGAGMQLERGPLGELWLSISNYRGTAKRFWEYASLGGAFWHGNIKAGFIVEVAGRREYPSAQEFLGYLLGARVSDTTSSRLIRSVAYQNGSDALRLDYDLLNTRPAGRWIHGERYQPGGLQSPLAVQGDSGVLQAGSARLITRPQPAWLVAQEQIPECRLWVAVNPVDSPTFVRLETPGGVLSAEAWRAGRIEWHYSGSGVSTITFDGVAAPAGLKTPAGAQVTIKSC